MDAYIQISLRRGTLFACPVYPRKTQLQCQGGHLGVLTVFSVLIWCGIMSDALPTPAKKARLIGPELTLRGTVYACSCFKIVWQYALCVRNLPALLLFFVGVLSLNIYTIKEDIVSSICHFSVTDFQLLRQQTFPINISWSGWRELYSPRLK